MKKILFVFLIIAVIALGYIFFNIYQNRKTNIPKVSETLGKFQESKTDSQNGVEILVSPKELIKGKPAKFALSFTTHEGDLDLDLTKAATLGIDEKVLQAQSWDGGSGGHHLSGNLIFPILAKEPAKIILMLENVAGANYQFTWQ